MFLGKEQRVFKVSTFEVLSGTNTNDNKFNLSNRSESTLKQNDIFYGDFSSEKIISNKQNVNIISSNLINFHNINADYIINRPDKNKVLSINTSVSYWFNVSAYNSQFDKEKNKDERISFFPTFINTPIDIAYSRNQSYFLLPISTQKYLNIVQPNLTLKQRLNGPAAILKNSYTKMFNHYWSQPTYTSEDNSIPIYDLNFSWVQTINLGSNTKVIEFLNKHNLLNFKYLSTDNSTIYTLSSSVIFNNETNNIDTKNGTCILLEQLLNVLASNSYMFNLETCKNIIHDLISQLNVNDIIRLLSPLGNITKLNDKIISEFSTDKYLSADFNNINITDINDCFNNQFDNSISAEFLPQNVVLNSDSRYPLQFADNYKIDGKYNPYVLPSAYYNILYLKNFRNPHYEFNVDIFNDNKFKHYEIKFGINNDNNIIITSAISTHEHDRNSDLNKLFDIDISKSIEAQIYNIDYTNTLSNNKNSQPYSLGYPNKATTSALVEYAKEKDTILALTNPEYQGKFPDRMVSKTKNYLEPFKNYHIHDNKVFNIRTIKWYKKLFQNSEISQILINFGLRINIKLFPIIFLRKTYLIQVYN